VVHGVEPEGEEAEEQPGQAQQKQADKCHAKNSKKRPLACYF
jgi:hypothetical protein